MLIHDHKPDPNRVREMKVNLPLDLHIRLHESKILHGERICDVVARALETYFMREHSIERSILTSEA